MQSTNIKQAAHRLVEQLPDNATWDDLMYEIYVWQAIEAGVIESDAGRTVDGKEMRASSGGPHENIMDAYSYGTSPGRL